MLDDSTSPSQSDDRIRAGAVGEGCHLPSVKRGVWLDVFIMKVLFAAQVSRGRWPKER